MANKFLNWLLASKEEHQHGTNADAAEFAMTHHSIERVVYDVHRVVDRHLERIYKRESALSDFAGIIAESPALNDGDS